MIDINDIEDVDKLYVMIFEEDGWISSKREWLNFRAEKDSGTDFSWLYGYLNPEDYGYSTLEEIPVEIREKIIIDKLYTTWHLEDDEGFISWMGEIDYDVIPIDSEHCDELLEFLDDVSNDEIIMQKTTLKQLIKKVEDIIVGG